MHFFSHCARKLRVGRAGERTSGRGDGGAVRQGDEWTDDSDELKPLMLRLKLKAHLRQHQQKWTTANAVPRPLLLPPQCPPTPPASCSLTKL